MAIDPGYLTASVAALAVVIAVGQWHTARTKLVLDLFELRLQVYDDLIHALSPVWRNGAADVNDIVAFSKPHDRANFLFGDDVKEYLGDIRKTLAELGLARDMLLPSSPDEERGKWAKAKHNAILKVSRFPEDFGALAAPYMRIDAKLPSRRISQLLRIQGNK